MFNLKKIGTAVAFVALTSFGAVSGASAANIFALPDGGTIASPDFGDTLFLRNGTSDFVPGGDLVVGEFEGFTDTFTIAIGDHNAPNPESPLRYNFNVTDDFDNPLNPSTIGLRNLNFSVERQAGGFGAFNVVDINGAIAGTDLTYTDGDGVNIAALTQFVGPWFDGDVIRWTVTGTGTLEGGGAYNITVNAATVPLPASVLMLVGALAGLGFIGRMKRSRFAAA